MTKNITRLLFFITCAIFAQQKDSVPNFSHFTTTELLLGKTKAANSGFPETKLQKSIVLNFGKYHNLNTDEWTYRLGQPRTGISFVITDYGNTEYIGYSASILPFMEFDFLRKNHKDLKMHVGIGASYFTNRYDGVSYALNNIPENNNRAISTKVTWAFRLFLYYELIKNKEASWRLGTGFFHQSNGHTKLPNQGLNSFLVSFSRQSNYNFKKRRPVKDTIAKPTYHKSSQNYFAFRAGAGLNVFSEIINDRKGIYTAAASFGKIINKTFKLGVGFYYRCYDHYYDYIKSGGELVVEQYPLFQKTPFKYSSNFGVFITTELLLGHIGFEIELGYNFYKPFYEIEWKLNQGLYWETGPPGNTETVFVLGKLDSYYRLKKAVTARLGLKYYLISNQKSPKSNLFIACNINANLGQADFTELSLGYVHRLNYKERRN